MGESSSIVVPPVESTPPQSTKPAETPKTPERPAFLPEKFKDVEQLAAAYVELEKKLGTPPVTPAAPATPAQATTGVPADVLSAVQAEFASKGALTDESFAKLETYGLPKQIVEGYVEGLKAKAAADAAAVHGVVGGKEKFDAMVAWAGTSMTDADIGVLNEMFAKGGAHAAAAARSLAASYTAANGSAPKLVDGEGGVVSQAVYESMSQLMDDMRSDKYKFDPAFRARVAEKLARSNTLM